MTTLASHPQRNSLRLQLRQNLVLQGMTPAQWSELEPHLRSGALDPVISATFPLEHAGDALATIDERRVTGKVVLETA